MCNHIQTLRRLKHIIHISFQQISKKITLTRLILSNVNNYYNNIDDKREEILFIVKDNKINSTIFTMIQQYHPHIPVTDRVVESHLTQPGSITRQLWLILHKKKKNSYRV